MGSQAVPDTGMPIRVSDTHQRRPIPPDLHRYWRSHEEYGYLERYWPDDDHEGWVKNIRAILASHLPDLATSDITYFAKGTFNRLYSITNPDWEGKAYVFRVSIPVEPFFKTESEVATMEYVRRHTSMPIPRVIAFSSSDDNELGHEWILMEMMPGQPLRTLWPRMPEEARVAVFAELAQHVKQLVALRFSKLGSIYFSDVADHVLPLEDAALPAGPSPNHKPCEAPGAPGIKLDRDIGPGNGFVLGRLVAQDFFFDKRIYYPGTRGPFTTTRSLIDVRASLLERRLRDLSPVPNQPWYCEMDREVSRHHARVLAIFQRLKALIPRLVPEHNGPEDAGVLWHDDLSEHNLLLDPVTFKLTAVLDWESVGVVPAYEAHHARPAWLSDRDWRPTPLVHLARGVPRNDEWLKKETLRRAGEMGGARRAYHEIVGTLYHTDEETKERARRKQKLAWFLAVDMLLRWPWWAEEWMKEEGLWEEGSGDDGADGSLAAPERNGVTRGAVDGIIHQFEAHGELGGLGQESVADGKALDAMESCATDGCKAAIKQCTPDAPAASGFDKTAE
ncbi:hypothetical protein VTJ83DRAFT_6417 [Remersonia thermophila]|uniref:Aminoglycoside phosphotransferase domain-containing protein n=1 Tax=Remersonia thermophila TaxID=72144 RepID=A0ABR4D4S5_9PEZI